MAHEQLLSTVYGQVEWIASRPSSALGRRTTRRPQQGFDERVGTRAERDGVVVRLLHAADGRERGRLR